MTIGVVKEIKNNEFRVGLTPDAVSAFVQAGHPVLVEKGAGLGSGFPDEEYVQAGATLEDTAESVWNKSGMIVKVKEPIECEYRFFRKDLILYTYLHLAADAPLTKALLESGMKAIAYETIVGRNGGARSPAVCPCRRAPSTWKRPLAAAACCWPAFPAWPAPMWSSWAAATWAPTPVRSPSAWAPM